MSTTVTEASTRAELEAEAERLSFMAMSGDPEALADLAETERRLEELSRAEQRAERAAREAERRQAEERRQQERDALARWLRRLEKAAADLVATAVQRETCQANQAEAAQKRLLSAYKACTDQAGQMAINMPVLEYRIQPRLDRLADRRSYHRELANRTLDDIVRSLTDGVLRKARRLLKEAM